MGRWGDSGGCLLCDPLDLCVGGALLPGGSPLRGSCDKGTALWDTACCDSHSRRGGPADRQAHDQPPGSRGLRGLGLRGPLLPLCSLPLVVLVAAVAGLLLSRAVPEAFLGRAHGSSDEAEYAIDETASNGRPSMLRNLKLLGTFVLLWALPFGILYLWRGGEDVLVKEALFFTGAAFLTFGGAYSVLSYVADVAVNHYGWLTADQMVQGLGLAESTPGPLIMVTQYVG